MLLRLYGYFLMAVAVLALALLLILVIGRSKVYEPGYVFADKSQAQAIADTFEARHCVYRNGDGYSVYRC